MYQAKSLYQIKQVDRFLLVKCDHCPQINQNLVGKIKQVEYRNNYHKVKMRVIGVQIAVQTGEITFCYKEGKSRKPSWQGKV